MNSNQKIVLAGLAVCLSLAQASADHVALVSITAGAQSPSPINAGESATYPLFVAKSGIGSLDSFLTVSGLPAGVTASCYPSVVSFTHDSPSIQEATLTVVTLSSLEPGTYPFTISASKGNGNTVVSTTATLLVGGSHRPVARPLLSIDPVAEGMKIRVTSAPGQLCYIEATTDLGWGGWTRIGTNSTDEVGLFDFIDVDINNFPMRFYRSVTPAN